MKKLKFIFLMVLGVNTANAQTPYVDVLTAPAMIAYSANLKNQQEKTNDELNNLSNMQGWVASQMVLANDIHNKLYKGLKEVNGTLQNGLQIQRIYKSLESITKNIDLIIIEAKSRPEYVVFGASATKAAVRKVVDVGTDVQQILSEDDLNLATAGDRRRLLGSIELNLRTLNVYLINIRLSIQRSKRKGWWNSINPFKSYVNTDKMIFTQIVAKSEKLKTW